MYSPSRERVENEARYIIEHHASLREAEKVLGLSKSTIHKDMRQFLPEYNPELGKQVGEIFKKHWNEKHVNGGNATKRKYELIREQEILKNTPKTEGVK